jgi:uncharacterized membrane protein
MPLMVGLMVTETFFHKIFKGFMKQILIGEGWVFSSLAGWLRIFEDLESNQ